MRGQALEEARDRSGLPAPELSARRCRPAGHLFEGGEERVRAGLSCGHGTHRDEAARRDVRDRRDRCQAARHRAAEPGHPGSDSRFSERLVFAKLTGSGRRVGYAPFILRPRQLGENRVAVVLPTLTWQAYNFRDDDGDGQEDTWYASPNVTSVLLGRPFEQRGVPPSYKYYDQPFLRWLIANKKEVDYLAQSDVADQTDGSLPPVTTCSSSRAITNT